MKPRITGSERWKTITGSVVKIVLAVLLVGGAVAVAQVAVKLLRVVLSVGNTVPAFYYLAYLVVSVLVAYLVYRTYVRLVEKRAVTELSGIGASRGLGVGALLGLGLVAATVGVLWLLGFYGVAGANAFTVVFVSLANDGAGAFVEEILLRGVIFRITEERLGTWLALAISVILFALLHLASSGATVISTIAVGTEGGILLSAAYVLSRRLWLAIGIHFGWDFAQDAVFGVGSAPGLIRGDLSGPALVSGGSAGVEGSVVALMLCLGVGAYLLVRANQQGDFISPPWNHEGQRTVQ